MGSGQLNAKGEFPPAAEPRTACAITAEAVWQLIAGGVFDLTTEAASQYALDRALVQTFGRSAVSREHRLSPRDRPDFLIDGRIVIEMKGWRHRPPAVLRQLARYAGYPQVEAIILATSRAMTMPRAFVFEEGEAAVAVLRRVEVRVVQLGRAWL